MVRTVKIHFQISFQGRGRCRGCSSHESRRDWQQSDSGQEDLPVAWRAEQESTTVTMGALPVSADCQRISLRSGLLCEDDHSLPR